MVKMETHTHFVLIYLIFYLLLTVGTHTPFTVIYSDIYPIWTKLVTE